MRHISKVSLRSIPCRAPQRLGHAGAATQGRRSSVCGSPARVPLERPGPLVHAAPGASPRRRALTTPATEAGTSAVDSATLAEAFRKTARAHPDLVAFRTLDGSVEITWSQARERVDAIAGGLAQLGVGH